MIAAFIIGIILIIGLGFNNGVQNVVGLILVFLGLFLLVFQLTFHAFTITDDLDMLLFTLLICAVPIGIGLTIIDTIDPTELNAKHVFKNFGLSFLLIVFVAILDLIQLTIETVSFEAIFTIQPVIGQIPDFEIPEIPSFEWSFEWDFDYILNFVLPTGWTFLFNLLYLLPVISIFIVTVINKIIKMKPRKQRWVAGKYAFLFSIYFLGFLGDI